MLRRARPVVMLLGLGGSGLWPGPHALARLPSPAGEIDASIHTLAVDFQRHRAPLAGESETASGRLYYLGPDRLLIHVQQPLEQILEIEPGHLKVFYPKSQESFDILTAAQETLPFFTFFAIAQRGEAEISAAGYTISHHESRGDTLFTYWDPPRKLRNEAGQAVLVSLVGDILSIQLKDRNDQPITQYALTGWREVSGQRFPSRVVIEVLQGPSSGVETVDYATPVLNEPPPDWVATFQIPADAVVRDLR